MFLDVNVLGFRCRDQVEALRAGLTTTPSPSSSISEGLDMFPESPQMHHHLPAAHYQMQQLSPGDFRPRASSNASSIGRLSPIPAVPESELQEPQWSPRSYHVAPGSAKGFGGGQQQADCFNPDNLLDLAENMKIRESGYMAPPSRKSSDAKLGHAKSADGFSSLYGSLVFANSLMEMPMHDNPDFPTPECSKSSKENSPKVSSSDKETAFINDLSSMPLMNPLPALQVNNTFCISAIYVYSKELNRMLHVSTPSSDRTWLVVAFAARWRC